MVRRLGILVAGIVAVLAYLVLQLADRRLPATPALAGADSLLDVPYGDDSPRQRLDLYRPPTPGPHPTVIWFHPGGWRLGDKRDSMPVWDWTRRGYAVVSVGHRLAFAPDTIGDAVDDAEAAVEHVLSHAAEWGLDPDRVGLFGFSAGGHLAAMVASRPLPVAAVVTVAAPTDLVALLDPASARFENREGADVVRSIEERLGCRGDACEPIATALSPARRPPGRGPLLVVHGDDDTVVSPDQATLLVDHVRREGGEAELVIVRDGGHGPIDHPRIAAFLDEQLLDR